MEDFRPYLRAASGRPRRVWAGRALAAAALLLTAACSSAPAPAPRSPAPAPRVPAAEPAPPSGPLAARLVSAAYALLGSPYRYAGSDPRGFDCSGLTRYLFAGAGFALPRTAAGQADAGRWVALDELAPGDLVFFAKQTKPNHVGLVVSAPDEPLKMIHASTSRGVIETAVLEDPYWLPRLRFGRRVLPVRARRGG